MTTKWIAWRVKDEKFPDFLDVLQTANFSSDVSFTGGALGWTVVAKCDVTNRVVLDELNGIAERRPPRGPVHRAIPVDS